MSKDQKAAESQKHSHYAQIPSSERKPLANARKTGPVDPDEEMTVTLLVRRPSIDDYLKKNTSVPLSSNRHLSREEFAEAHGADQEDIEKVKQFANEHNLEVKEINEAAGTVLLAGKTASFSKAFKVELEAYEHPDFTYRGRTGHVSIPTALEGVVEAVLGLDDRPQVRAHFQILKEDHIMARASSTRMSYTPPQIAELYNFPTGVDCSDQSIAIIELGGGYDPSELQNYFASLGVPQPNVKAVGVNGATNKPTGSANGPDGEVVLDVEVAGAVAPGVNIAVYFAPNTDAGFLNAIKTAVHDTENKPSVISISWGAAESQWTEQAMKAMDRAFQDAAAVGVTVCCASGDRGSADGETDGLVHVDFPASSPHALACGGTKLEGTGKTISNEVVWNEGPDSSTGGGVSSVFDLPDWQASADVPVSANPNGSKGRGVPDVAGDADPATGYKILVDGQEIVIGGTSAVAPLWAGLLALINKQNGQPVGFVNPALYDPSARNGAFRDIVEGNNESASKEKGAYTARIGWDPCTGWGSPDGTALMNYLKGLQQK